MSCPACKYPIAVVLGPVFKFRRRRWYDRFIHAHDELKVPGLTKLWAGYDCMCGSPSCATAYRLTRQGAKVVAPSSAPHKPAVPQRHPTPDDDGLPPPGAAFPLDADLLLPGERPPR